MKSDFSRRLYGQELVNILYSTLVACLVEIFLIANVDMIVNYLEKTQGSLSPALKIFRMGTATTILYVIAGIGIFSLTFLLLQRKSIRYIGKIAAAIQNISEGDLNIQVEVEGDDEFAMMAASLNRMEADIRELMDKERESERTKNELITNVAHDLRTPLTSIIGSTSAILETPDLSLEQQHQLLEDVRDDAQWLVRVVENLLSITRMGEDTRITKQPEAAEEVLGEVARKFRKHYPDVKISVAVPDELLIVPMDAILIEQVMTNLLENAVRHGKNTTHIALSVHQEGENAVFAVQDNGGGIPPKLLPVLFSGTLRHSDTPTGDGKRNMGLGLSVCNAIVRAHGGTMHAQNKDGGAEFIFLLPMIEKEPELQ